MNIKSILSLEIAVICLAVCFDCYSEEASLGYRKGEDVSLTEIEKTVFADVSEFITEKIDKNKELWFKVEFVSAEEEYQITVALVAKHDTDGIPIFSRGEFVNVSWKNGHVSLKKVKFPEGKMLANPNDRTPGKNEWFGCRLESDNANSNEARKMFKEIGDLLWRMSEEKFVPYFKIRNQDSNGESELFVVLTYGRNGNNIPYLGGWTQLKFKSGFVEFPIQHADSKVVRSGFLSSEAIDEIGIGAWASVRRVDSESFDSAQRKVLDLVQSKFEAKYNPSKFSDALVKLSAANGTTTVSVFRVMESKEKEVLRIASERLEYDVDEEGNVEERP